MLRWPVVEGLSSLDLSHNNLRSGVECVALSGNYCVDKKPAAINFQEGRGKRIYAEALLEAPILHHQLKTNARDLVEVVGRTAAAHEQAVDATDGDAVDEATDLVAREAIVEGGRLERIATRDFGILHPV